MVAEKQSEEGAWAPISSLRGCLITQLPPNRLYLSEVPPQAGDQAFNTWTFVGYSKFKHPPSSNAGTLGLGV
jgi:hypothetical protein